jgi:hypothetical protein
VSDLEPIEGDRASQTILEALGVDDLIRNLPDEDRSNLDEIRNQIMEILKLKGVAPTTGSMKRYLEQLRESMDIDPDTEPARVLSKIGGVVKAWKSLSFVTDPKERRSIFMRLARQPDSKAMDRVVLEEYEKRKVWQ